MEIIAENPEDIPRAYSLYYSRMAETFSHLIKPSHPRVILEAGCGRGQLTLPLLKNLPAKTKLIGVDSSRGPYAGWLEELQVRVDQLGLADRVQLVQADVREMSLIRSETIDAIISNELLCDLPRESQLKEALSEFRRVLRPGGLMVHGEWSSFPENKEQSLMIKHWPSWNPDQLFRIVTKAGYHSFLTTYFDQIIVFHHKAAVEELRSWGASASMIKRNDRILRRRGIQLPFEHIVRCRK